MKILLGAAMVIALAGIAGESKLSADESQDLSLWYDKPAGNDWSYALPLGNGRLGLMVFGNVDNERLMFNEDSLWSGWAVEDANREGSLEALKKARVLIQQKKNKEADQILLNDFCSLYGYGKKDFGAFQSFFDARLVTGHNPDAATNYHRKLDLEVGIATVSYTYDGVAYKREAFCSHPAQVSVMSFTADKPGQISFTLSATSLHKKIELSAQGNQLILSGQIETGNTNFPGMLFEGRMQVRSNGGNITAKGNSICVKGADSATIIMAGATNYKLEYPKYRGTSPDKKNISALSRIASISYKELRQKHVEDHAKLFGRVDLTLEGVSRSDLPTNERMTAYKKDRTDRGLETLLFQYGRYLLIASSRLGGLPANLQGLWNNSNTPPWNGDYHLNINMEMNYWPAGNANLDECFHPLADWVTDLTKPGAESAKIHYGARGWVAHHCANPWGMTAPGPRRGVHMLEAESGAFISQNIWDHYAFTQDRKYLEKTAWPILKGAALFWIDNLQEVEGGYLAVNPSYSPEHGPLSDGAYYQTMIIWDLFTHCIEAGQILGTDAKLCKQLQELRSRLQPPEIGSYGQICEWRDPNLEKNANKDKHRHVSHMYAVYPGHQIIAGRDKELTSAAIKSMNYRGDAATGWSMGWKINLWARLLDGDHAHKLIGNLISSRLYPNLWDSHPPFQIDGNFGYTAGVLEMLLQSHEQLIDKNESHYNIVLLPALPSVWSNGSVNGLCARGGFIVDLSWKDGKLTKIMLTARQTNSCVISYGSTKKELKVRKGETVHLDGSLAIL